MTQVNTSAPHATERPSIDSCTRLLRAMPAMSAFRRAIRDVAPTDTLGWLGTMVVIARHDAGIRPSAVAEHLMVDLSVASRAIAHLEELSYVERARDPRDGRAWNVQATDAGRARLAELTAGFAQHMRDLLVDWSDADVECFADQLVRFHSSLELHLIEFPAAKDAH